MSQPGAANRHGALALLAVLDMEFRRVPPDLARGALGREAAQAGSRAEAAIAAGGSPEPADLIAVATFIEAALHRRLADIQNGSERQPAKAEPDWRCGLIDQGGGARLRRRAAPAVPTGPFEAKITRTAGRGWLPRYARTAARVVPVVVGLFVLYALYGTALLQGRSQQGLAGSTNRLHLIAADIGLDQRIVSGDARADLAQGPGLAPGSGSLADGRPIVIAGPRTTHGAPFKYLSTLRVGETVTLRRGSTQSQFSVVTVATMSPRAAVRIPSGLQRLYLVTSAPALDTRRLVVTAVAIAPATAPTGTGVMIRLPALDGDRVDLPLAAVALAAVVAEWVAWRDHRQGWAAPVGWAWLLVLAGTVWISWQLLLGAVSPLL